MSTITLHTERESQLSIRRHKLGIAKNRAMRLEGQLHKTRNYIKRLEDEMTMLQHGNLEILNLKT